MLFTTTQGTFLFVVLSAVIFEEVLSIKCYQCNTYESSECWNPSQSTVPYETCGGATSANETDTTEWMCRKIEQEINIHGDDTKRIIRQCATRVSATDGCLERTGTYRFKSWYCECKTDGCNGASITTLSTTVSMVIFAAMFMRKYFL